MKLIYLIIGMICLTGVGSAGINDTNFSIYNEGSVSYFVYMYDYTGDDPTHYQDSYIGELETGESIAINDKASYRLYAEYNDIQNFGSIDYVEKKFNQWWFVSIIILLLLIGAITIYRVIKK